MLSDDEGPRKPEDPGAMSADFGRYPIVLHPYQWIHLIKKNVQMVYDWYMVYMTYVINIGDTPLYTPCSKSSWQMSVYELFLKP